MRVVYLVIILNQLEDIKKREYNIELVNIYNDKHEYLGICEKDTTHVIGAWHDVFTCLIFSPIRKTVILQIKNYSHNETIQMYAILKKCLELLNQFLRRMQNQ